MTLRGAAGRVAAADGGGGGWRVGQAGEDCADLHPPSTPPPETTVMGEMELKWPIKSTAGLFSLLPQSHHTLVFSVTGEGKKRTTAITSSSSSSSSSHATRPGLWLSLKTEVVLAGGQLQSRGPGERGGSCGAEGRWRFHYETEAIGVEPRALTEVCVVESKSFGFKGGLLSFL